MSLESFKIIPADKRVAKNHVPPPARTQEPRRRGLAAAQRRQANKGNCLIPYAEVRSCIKEHPQKQLRRRARGGGPVIASAITRQRRRGPPSPVYGGGGPAQHDT
jgi:hypothetical protein